MATKRPIEIETASGEPRSFLEETKDGPTNKQANEGIIRRTRKRRKLMEPTNFPVGEANGGPKWKRGRKPQIAIKSIGRVELWDVHEIGVDFEEIWIDLTVETVSEEWKVKLILDSPTQAEELITKLRAALAQKSEDKTGTETDPNDKGELHEHN
jgi:hypothetical protein